LAVKRKLPRPEVPPEDVEERFQQLQQKLPALWEWIGRTDPGGPNQEENTIVVVPSMTADIELTTSEQQAYEERFLFLLFILRQPGIRLIFITSSPIQSSIVDYYLGIVPGAVVNSMRKRLFLVSPLDGSTRPLTEKLLERPRLIQHIRSLIPDPDRAHVVPFLTTDLERELAIHLGIPMYGADPRFFAFGTKSGSRRIFAEESLPHALGSEDLFSAYEIIDAIAKMRAKKPELGNVIVKLNEGVSGIGNAVVKLDGLPAPGDASERPMIAERLQAMQFELKGIQYESYMRKVSQRGAIVEQLVVGEEIHSPSAQLRVSPLGEVEQLSTHDQILGGPSDQSYIGSRFPADPAYGRLIMREAAKIGRRFAKEGIVGRFAVDFVVVRSDNGKWEPYAIEVNLRKGGTTNPFLTLQYLTDGIYDPEEGVFRTALGHQKCYISSDHVESHLYRVFTPGDLFDIVTRYRFHFDHTSQTGIVLHMMSGVADLGRLGVTAIANTHEEAETLYNRFLAVLDDEALASLQATK
jgi:hypothetical protein